MFCFCFFHTFAPIFHFKLCNFCKRGQKNISCLRAPGTLATPLQTAFQFEEYLNYISNISQINTRGVTFNNLYLPLYHTIGLQ